MILCCSFLTFAGIVAVMTAATAILFFLSVFASCSDTRLGEFAEDVAIFLSHKKIWSIYLSLLVIAAIGAIGSLLIL